MGAGRRSGQFRSGGGRDAAERTPPRAAGKTCGVARPRAILRFSAAANDNRPSGRTLLLTTLASATTVALALAWLLLRP